MAGVNSLTFISLFIFIFSPVCSTEVFCGFMKDCVLPCCFQSGSKTEIHWRKTQGALVVHSFSKNQNQLRRQHQNYTNRTSLFVEEISRGNASLLLRGVRVDDEGEYICDTRTDKGSNVSYITIKVTVNITEVTLQKEGDVLVCKAEGIYPQPNVSWTPSTEHRTTVNKRHNGLYFVVSSVSLSLHSSTHYTCNVSTQQSSRSATYRLHDPTIRMFNQHWPAVVPVIVFTVALLVLFVLFRRYKGQKKLEPVTTDPSVSGENPNRNNSEHLEVEPPESSDQENGPQLCGISNGHSPRNGY